MRFRTLVNIKRGTASHLRPVPDAVDEAEAAFIAADWQRDTWPWVEPLPGNAWSVSDGMQSTIVHIMSKEES